MPPLATSLPARNNLVPTHPALALGVMAYTHGAHFAEQLGLGMPRRGAPSSHHRCAIQVGVVEAHEAGGRHLHKHALPNVHVIPLLVQATAHGKVDILRVGGQPGCVLAAVAGWCPGVACGSSFRLQQGATTATRPAW